MGKLGETFNSMGENFVYLWGNCLSLESDLTLTSWDSVIVMTFWYVFWNELNFFELFKLYFLLGLITTPHVLYVHMTYVYPLFPMFSHFILHTIVWPREVTFVL